MSGWAIWAWLLVALLGVGGPAAPLTSVPPAAPAPAVTPSPAASDGSTSWHGFEPDADGTLVRVVIHQGYATAQVSLSADGRVVRVADTSVSARTSGFVTWTLSDTALDRALGSLARLGLLDAEPGTFGDGAVTPDTRSVGVFFGQGRVISGSEGSPRFPRLWRAVVRLVDPTSYGDGLVTGPEPWVPAEIGLVLSRPDAANPYPLARWPFPEPIEQMASPAPPGSPGSPGELKVCLRGAQAARLFSSLPGGVVGVFRWSDGATTWSGRVDVTTPGYRLRGSGCDPA